MISVYDIGNDAFTQNGDAILHPTSCDCTEDAGGSYEVAMIHPLTEEREWEHLVCGAIIKCPVPVPTIENAYVGQDVDVYKINSNNTALREGPGEPERITYQEFYVSTTPYAVGTKVTWYSQNYQCIALDPGWPDTGYIHTPQDTDYWKTIPNYTYGYPVLVTLKADTEVYYVEASGSYWAKVSTKNGIIGYVKNSQITFVRHETVQPVPPRTVEDQLFRIYSVDFNTKNNNVTVNARHVSYDLSGVLIGECKIALADPALLIARIRDAMLIDYQGEIATNLTSEDNGTYTGDVSYKNGTYCFLDPDKGVIPYFRAKLIRDNWDLFLMQNDLVDRGVRLTYGVNLRGVTWKRKSDGLINRVMPVAKAADGSDLFLPEQWIDSEDIDNWPVIVMEKLKVDGQVGKDDGSGTDTNWTESALLDHRREKAEERFTVDHVDALVTEVTVDFTLLGTTEEYKQFWNLERLYMYDLVSIRDPRITMDLHLQISQIRYDCILGRYKSVKIGNVYDYGGRTVFGYNIGDGAIEYEKISSETIRRIASDIS